VIPRRDWDEPTTNPFVDDDEDDDDIGFVLDRSRRLYQQLALFVDQDAGDDDVRQLRHLVCSIAHIVPPYEDVSVSERYL
jgi:hypothetical protein